MNKPSGNSSRMGAKEIVILGLLGALLFTSTLALAALPNVEPASLLIMVYTVVLGKKALFPIYIFVGLEYLIWGFNVWSVCYLYVWLVLAVAAYALRRMESPVGWAVLSGAFGCSFGALCALAYLPVGGWSYALSWWISGIPFDLLHCAGNFALALVLFRPCKKALTRLAQAAHTG